MAHSIRISAAVGAAVLSLGLLAGCSSDAGTSQPSASSSARPSGSAGDAASTQGTATDEQTAAAEAAADEFFSLLQRNDVEGLDDFLSPAFQIVRIDGSSADKAQYLANPADVGAYHLSDFNVTAAGDALVARYTVVTVERIDQQLYLEDPRQRLSVFVPGADGELQLLAHANLNTPNNDAETPPATDQESTPPRTSSSAEDVKIAEDTQNAFFQALKDGDAAALEKLLSPAFQLVRADGSSATKSEYLANPATMNSFELTDFITTREGDLIVAKFVGTTNEVIDGTEYKGDPADRFAVMQRNGDTWRIIAQVNFNSPDA
jgi:outer membrane murein-binding lipoprotein Lpp